jgi:glycolate oxidase FAD binding subunit
MASLSPASVPELVEAVRSTPRLLAIGAGTKPRLASVDATRLSTAGLQGILEYDPSEFTFTALAGTPVRQIAAALAEKGQHLPFDPMCSAAGSTLGGTVAAGLSGPGRFRFGGVRDFILGIRFVDGAGRLLRMGGKVVKNAAGFDVPKFFVGSLGRFGVLAEITFKVFPSPPSRLTLRLAANGSEKTAQILCEAANTRWEPDALDVLPGGKHICLRLAGPASALEEISCEVLGRWQGERLSQEEAKGIWRDLREFVWTYPDGPLIKIALNATMLPALHKALASCDGARVHISSGGNVAFVSLPADAQIASLNESLRNLNLCAMTLRGSGPLWLGVRSQSKITQAVKNALDPENRFPSLDE